MPQYQAPTPTPTWAESSDALASQPTPSQLATGYTLNQRPTPDSLNWVLRQLSRGYKFLAQGINATLVGAVQEVDWRLLGGGVWSFNATTGVLAWSEPFVVAMPGLTDDANTGAAGAVTLTAGQLAYANCNAAFGSTGTLTSGSKTVSDLAFESGITVNATVSGPGVPAGATVVAISTTDSTITLSAAATASTANVNLVFATSGPLTVKAADTASFAPSSNTVVLARCVAVASMPNHVVVGLNAGVMMLRDGEQKRLLGTGYVSTFAATAGEDLAANTPVYISPGGFSDSNRTQGAVYSLDASAFAARARFAGVCTSAAVAGNRAEVVAAGRVNCPASNLTAGATYYASGTTAGALTATAPSAASQYVVPVGAALSSTTLLLAPGATPTLTAATYAYKSVVDMGSYWSTSSGAGFLPLVRTIFNAAQSTNSTMVEAQPMTHAGSIVGIAVHANNSVSSPMIVAVIKNGTQLLQQYALLPNTTDKTTTYARQTYPFAAGDVLSARVMFNADGGGGPNVTGLNIALKVSLTVELTP